MNVKTVSAEALLSITTLLTPLCDLTISQQTARYEGGVTRTSYYADGERVAYRVQYHDSDIPLCGVFPAVLAIYKIGLTSD